jgi:hypothetical protein
MSGLGRSNAEQKEAADRAKAIVAAMTGNGNPTPKAPLTTEAMNKN